MRQINEALKEKTYYSFSHFEERVRRRSTKGKGEGAT